MNYLSQPLITHLLSSQTSHKQKKIINELEQRNSQLRRTTDELIAKIIQLEKKYGIEMQKEKV